MALGLAVIFSWLAAGRAKAEVLTTVYAFTNALGGTDGGTPDPGLILSTNGVLYGATLNGGSNGYGGLFYLTTNGALTPWHAFNYNPDGASPSAGVIRGSNGLFYGTTPLAGAASTNQGCVFQISAAGAFTTLYSFPGSKSQTNSTGAAPPGTLVQGTNGQLYGVTSAAGPRTNGTIYSLTTAGQITLRYTFTNGIDGGKPLAGLFLSSNGNFYGTTSTGGSNGAGTIFKLTHAGALTPLYSFASNADGFAPQAPLVQTPGGLLVGAAASGGANKSGTIFQITTNGAFHVVYTFSAQTNASPKQNPDGASPRTVLVNAAGNYWGVASAGGTNGEGSVFELTPAGAFRSVYAFLALSFSIPATNIDGANPNGILQAPDGSYYVTTAHGGNGAGTVVRLTTPPAPIAVAFSSAAGDIQYVSGQFQARLTNIPAGAGVVIEASTDLANWTAVFTNLAAPAQMPFSDTGASNYPFRFYRAIISP